MKPSFAQRLAAYFKDHPGRWIDGKDLEPIAGRYAWRSRVSDCRKHYGMVIENRERKITLSNGDVFTASEYRYVAPVIEEPAFELTA